MESDLIVRHVLVNRTRAPMEAIDATGRRKYVDRHVVETMPQGVEGKLHVVFFRLDYGVDDIALDREYRRFRLRPADPYELAAVNEADPAFADEYTNSTHWKDGGGNWCYSSFFMLPANRGVNVLRSDRLWIAGWSFAGVPIRSAYGSEIQI